MARYTLHGIWLSGPTYKVGLMLSLTDSRYDYEHVDLRAGAHKADAFLARNRYGQVPVLEDHQTDICLCQSSVILEYLAQETGRFAGKDRSEALRVREWQFWAAGQLSSGIYRTRAAQLGFFSFPDDVRKAHLQAALSALRELDTLLAGRTWLVGNAPTIADIDLYGVVAYSGQGKIDLHPFASIHRWMAACEALPGFRGIAECLPQSSLKAG